MREQETAATVQDVEVRQMELESQRQLFEQVTVRKLYRCLYLMVLPMQFSIWLYSVNQTMCGKIQVFFFFVIFNTFFLNKPSDNKNSSNTHSYPFFWEKMPISSPFYSSSEQRHHVVDAGFICILSCLREVRNM